MVVASGAATAAAQSQAGRQSLGGRSRLRSAVNTVSASMKMAKGDALAPAPAPAPAPPNGTPAVPSKCVVRGKGVEMAIARQLACFEIEAHGEDGRRLRFGGEQFFVAVRGKSLVKAKVVDRGDGVYMCEYRGFRSPVSCEL